MSRGQIFPDLTEREMDERGCGKNTIAFTTVASLHPTTRVRDTFARGDQIKFPNPESKDAINDILAQRYKFPSVRDPLLRLHLKRVWFYLNWWYDRNERLKRPSFCTPVVALMQNLADGPTYADYIDDCIKYSFRGVTAEVIYYGRDKVEDFVDMNAWGFDYFPSPFHLLPWERPRCTEDFDIAFTEEKAILNLPLLDEFREEVRRSIHVPKHLDVKLDDLDAIALCKSSTVMVSPWKTKINLFERTERGFPQETTENFKFMESSVYKNPHESRACWIPDVETYNSIRLLHKLEKQVFRQKHDFYHKRPSYGFLSQWLAAREGQYFIMSDLKKSGLTFPRALVRIIREECEALFPGAPFSLLKGWENKPTIYRENRTIERSTCGLGLGMNDPLISFAMGCIFAIWKRKLPEDNEMSVRGIFWSDDQVIKVENALRGWLPVQGLALHWDRVCSQLGLSIHEKKPFVSKEGVLLETYSERRTLGWDKNKLGQWGGAYTWCLTCQNIAEAKHLFAAISDCIWDDWSALLGDIREEVIRSWGYEFFPREVDLPYELGGWERHYDDERLNQWLIIAESLPWHLSRLAKLHSIQLPRLVRGGWSAPEEMRSGFLECTVWTQRLLKNVLHPHYIRPSTRRLNETWSKLLKKREQIWGGPNSDPRETVRNYFGKIPGSCVFPSAWCIRRGDDPPDGFEFSLGDDPFPFAKGDPQRAKVWLCCREELEVNWHWDDLQAQQSILKAMNLPSDTKMSVPLLRYCIDNEANYSKIWRNLASRNLDLIIEEDSSSPSYKIVPGKGKYLFMDEWSKWIVALDEVKGHFPMYSSVLSTYMGFPITRGEALEVGHWSPVVITPEGEQISGEPRSGGELASIVASVALQMKLQCQIRDESVQEAIIAGIGDDLYPDLDDALEDVTFDIFGLGDQGG